MNLPVKPLYRQADLEGFDEEADLGVPGEYPFTRGPYPGMYTQRLWTMRQYAGFGTAAETNRRFRYLIEQGNTGLSVAFDLPTQMGLDSDDPRADGEVGRLGVAIDTVSDMEALFAGIPLDQVSTSMTINAPAAVLLAMYVVAAERQGVSPEAISGTVQNDVLKEYVARGTYIFPPQASMRLAVEVLRYCAESLPRFNGISISGYHMREAGATAVQEVAFTLANALAYVEAASQAGIDMDRIGPQLSFFFAAHSNFFEEVAKFRAARRLWAELARHRLGVRDPRSWRLRFHTQTAGVTLTAQQPLVNVVRVALQALSAVLGGTQSLHTNSYDEALALPTEAAAALALRTQQVIAYETGVADSADPLAGSYMVERLTLDMLEAAREEIRRIDAMGGAVRAIELGHYHREIENSAYQHQLELESGHRVVVGVNRFVEAEQARVKVPVMRVDPRVQQEQIARLRRARQQRDPGRVRKALEAVEMAAREEAAPLMPAILEAVRAEATVGEVCGRLAAAFGRYGGVEASIA